MTKDPIVAEIHAVRAKMLEECGGDMKKLIARIHKNTRALGIATIRLPASRQTQPNVPGRRRQASGR